MATFHPRRSRAKRTLSIISSCLASRLKRIRALSRVLQCDALESQGHSCANERRERYMKPDMTDRAAPVKFTTLIEKTAAGLRVPRGPETTIKRR
jgi:hypothetical protein